MHVLPACASGCHLLWFTFREFFKVCRRCSADSVMFMGFPCVVARPGRLQTSETRASLLLMRLWWHAARWRCTRRREGQPLRPTNPTSHGRAHWFHLCSCQVKITRLRRLLCPLRRPLRCRARTLDTYTCHTPTPRTVACQRAWSPFPCTCMRHMVCQCRTECQECR